MEGMRWVRASEQTAGVTEGEEEVLEERKKSEGKSKSRKKQSERASVREPSVSSSFRLLALSVVLSRFHFIIRSS